MRHPTLLSVVKQPRMRRKHHAPIIDLPSGQTTISTTDALEPSEEDASSAPAAESLSDDDTDTTLKYSNTLYRLPSSSIALNFFDSTRKHRERSHTRSSVDPFPSPRASDASPPKKLLNSYTSSQTLDEQEAREVNNRGKLFHLNQCLICFFFFFFLLCLVARRSLKLTLLHCKYKRG